MVQFLAIMDKKIGPAQDADGPAGFVDDRGSADGFIREEGQRLADIGVSSE